MSRYSKSMSDTMAEVRANEEKLLEVSPPGFKGTVKAMKKHDDIDNPYALAWHMKNKGDKAHYKDKDGRPEKKEKYKEEVEFSDILIEGLSMKDPKLNKLFDKLKRGDTVTIEYTSAMSRGKDKFKVTAKNVVGKMRVEKITLKSVKNPRSVKHYLYKRNGGVTMAQGDMATSIESIKENIDALHAEALQENEMLNEVEWKVKLRGLPIFYVPAKSAGEIRAMLRKQIKKPDDIISIERTTKAAKKQDFRGRVQGQDSED